MTAEQISLVRTIAQKHMELWDAMRDYERETGQEFPADFAAELAARCNLSADELTTNEFEEYADANPC